MANIPSITGLAVENLIKVKVRAQNINGWGVYSEPNNSGQVVHTIPLTMDAVTFDFAEILNTEITIYWQALTGVSTGGLTVNIDNYEL